MKRVLVTGGSGFIGVHLVSHLISLGYKVSNLDIRSPIDGLHVENWRKTSILDADEIESHIFDFQPNFIVHLAAVTTQDAKHLNQFETNIFGTEVVLRIASKLNSLEKFIFTSSQYVVTPGMNHSPASSSPYGLYGESKLIGENLTREILESQSWTIIRPAAIWGPWHSILSKGLWQQINRHRYYHPSQDFALKGYGFVKNSVWQIEKILQAPDEVTSGMTFYIGDGNFSQSAWVEAFSQALRNQGLFHLPQFAIYLLSEFGEVLKKIGITVPIYRSRFRNLITSNPVPLEPTLDLFGTPPITFNDAVKETVKWFLSAENTYHSSQQKRRGSIL